MKRILLTMLILFPFLVVAACSGGGEKYGTGVDAAAPEVSVADVFLKPALRGQNVTLAGKIATQCASNGCWFVLQDDTGQIYIDLSRSNFTLPAMPGRAVKASGTIVTQQNNLYLIAQGVEVL
jgi:uncharacterized protein YdeI (BOF family)